MVRRSLFLLLVLFWAGTAFATGTGETPAAPEETAGEIRALSLLYPKAVASVPLLMVLEAYPEDYTGAFFTDHAQALAQLIQGEVDVLTTGFSVGFGRFSTAGDLVHLITPVWGVSALMTAEPIESLTELAGGTVYAPFEGSPIDIYLKAVLARDGLTDSVEIAYAPFPQSAGLLAQKKIAASVLVEPLASKLEIAGAAHRFENLQEGWARINAGEARSPQVSAFVTRDTAAADAFSLALFRERCAEAARAVAEDPAGAAASYAESLGFPVPVVQRALENTLFDVPGEHELRSIIDSYAAVMGLEAPGDAFYPEF